MRRTATLVFTLLALTLIGVPANALTGGPDGAGYYFADQADGVVYNYVNIVGTGVPLVNDDDATVAVPFPAGVTFPFYGAELAGMRASTNGWLSEDTGSTWSDVSNDCPLPATPDLGATARIAALHDDLITTVYYQYFDETQAAAIGFPGQPGGVSIVQWVGEHWSSGNLIDLEAVLFHSSGQILVQVAVDGDTGSSSTTGIQDYTASDGLSYACNTAGSIVPGTTAVMFTPAPWFSEIRIDHDGTDTNEYVELEGFVGTQLPALTLVVIGDGTGGSGVIERAVSFTDHIIGGSGFFVTATGTFTLGVADHVAQAGANWLENDDNLTFMLVLGFSGAAGNDLDTNDDGVLDVTPWTAIVDRLAVIKEENPPTTTEYHYGPPTVGPDGGSAPGHVFYCDSLGSWLIGQFELANGQDTPGAANACPVCGNGLAEVGEDCDGDGQGNGGETADCDADCTLPLCGDGTVNTTAGEICDDGDGLNDDDCPDGAGGTCVPAVCGDGWIDAEAPTTEVCDGDGAGTGGETATCDVDCTTPSCGDGVTNAAAGEACDDGAVDTATCDFDCTSATCGDSYVNAAAGETCDDGGETASCDLDCTAASCGDSVTNVTAGEDCDGGGVDTAGCNADCSSAECGDSYVNTAAGETCDHGGETDTCDADCTDVACGDGTVNATAGEDCDDGGESATCNDDCSDASCGDGIVNATANEDCDDSGESATCDDDCTIAECGDGTINATAGEECDDGNTTDGDGCSSTCVSEGTGGAGGSTSSGTGGSTSSGTGGSTSSGTGGSTSSGSPADDGEAEGGCGCTTPGSGDDSDWQGALALLLGLSALGRRRRR